MTRFSGGQDQGCALTPKYGEAGLINFLIFWGQWQKRGCKKSLLQALREQRYDQFPGGEGNKKKELLAIVMLALGLKIG
jgi:hypothetical protein